MLVQIRVFKDEDGAWCASGVDQGIHTQGETLDELFANIEEATQLHLEEELAAGVRLALETTHSLAEGAGAASLAAAVKIGDRLRGKKVVCVMSGGNIDRETLLRVLACT